MTSAVDVSIDEDAMVEFLTGLLNISSPTGFTDNAMAYIQEHFSSLPLTMQKTPKGLLVGSWQGAEESAPRALTAHVDTLGAMVREIKENGRLTVTQLGGWVWSSVEGEGATIFTAHNGEYRGSFLPTMASVHAHSQEEKNAVRTEKNMEIRIDAQTRSRVETEALGIRVGDFVAFDPRVELTDSGFIRSRHLDDKASVATIYGALMAMAAAGLQPRQTTTIHISNYEEVGHGAAAGFPPDLHELISIDMAVVAPGQTSDEFSVTICAKDTRGPYHYELRRRLEALATENGIDAHTDTYPFYGSDGEALWRAGGDVAVALIGPGVDASHHYERTHRDSLINTTKLLIAYLLS